MPVSRKGAIMISEAGLPVKLLKKIPAAINAATNKMPPISSHFHATTSTAIIMKAGMLCIIRQMNASFPPNSKQSIENIIMKRMARIARMRGVQ